MGFYKSEYFWRSTDDEGWSERFWQDASTIDTAQSQLDSFASQLLALRSANFQMVYARVSDVTQRGSSLPSGLTFPQDGTYVPPTGADRLEANSCLNVVLFANSTAKGRWFLRGLFSDKIVGREVKPSATWDANFAIVAGTLKGGLYFVKHRTSKGPPPVYTYISIGNAYVTSATARKPGRPFGLLRGRRTVPD